MLTFPSFHLGDKVALQEGIVTDPNNQIEKGHHEEKVNFGL